MRKSLRNNLDNTAPVGYSQFMRSHYAITSTIHYYKIAASVEFLPGRSPRLREAIPEGTAGGGPFDFSRWKDAPHVALANLRDEPEAVLRFTRTYGVLGRDYYKGKARTVSVRQVLQLRDWLRRAWEGDPYNFFAVAITHPSLVAQPTGMMIAVDDPWTLVQVMFAQDCSEGRIKKCANPDCPAPYFRAVRKGQKFCSQRCGVLINVRRFRDREAKRKAKGGKHAKAKKA
jgi:hypothetical protein